MNNDSLRYPDHLGRLSDAHSTSVSIVKHSGAYYRDNPRAVIESQYLRVRAILYFNRSPFYW